MEDATVKGLKQAFLDLPTDQRQQLAEEVLPLLLTTRAGLTGIDQVMQTLSEVVLDTQVLLRGAAAKTDTLTARIYDAWRTGRFVLLLSEPILREIAGVLTRPEVLQKLRLSVLEACAVLALLRRRSVLVSPEKREAPIGLRSGLHK